MSDDGIELLIHVGMDTVEMKGNGFTSLTKEGSKVKAGTPPVIPRQRPSS